MAVEVAKRAWKVRVEISDAYSLERFDHGIVKLDYGINGILLGMTKQSIAEIVRPTYTSSTEKRISAHIGQIYTAVNDIKIGDLLVVPTEKGRSFSIGDVHSIGIADDNQSIEILTNWKRREIPLFDFHQDLRYSFMAIMKLCEVKRNNAAYRLHTIANGNPDPGPN